MAASEIDDFIGKNDDEILTLDQNEEEIDRIAEIFKDRCLFISGGTGFMGKVLVEKLLRSCGDLKKIYLLIRPKKGKHPDERIKEMFNNVLFDLVKKQKGEDVILSKVAAIAGDVTELGLGIQPNDLETLRNEVTIIYHCAATVRFDEPLRKAVFMNTRGTKYMLEFAKSVKHLDFFAHVSTAYCHLHVKTLYERVYDPPANPHKVISACEWLTDEQVAAIEQKILGDIPNTYAYTKSLSESLVAENFGELPAMILRPSIVIPVWREPVPGWTDNINGPTGLLIAAGKGILRTMYCNSTCYGDFLPVDVSVNGMLVSSWYFLAHGKKEVNQVAHMTSSKEIKVSWNEIVELGRWVIENKMPLNWVAWYPGGSFKTNYYVHCVCALLQHWLPAVFIDLLARLFGYPPFMLKVHRRLANGLKVFEYYANNVWDFDNTEALRMRKLLNERERRTYIIEKVDLDLVDYFTNCTICARRLILKETDDTIPTARRHMKVMWCMDRFFKALFFFALLYFLYNYFLDRLSNGETVIQKPLE